MLTLRPLLIFLLSAQVVLGATKLENAQLLRQQYGIELLRSKSNQQNVTILVLDKEFGSFSSSRNSTQDSGYSWLPRVTDDVVLGPIASKFPFRPIPDSASHGLRGSQIIWELSGRTENGPRFILANVAKFQDLVAVIDKVVAGEFGKIDIVVHAINHVTKSNFDGTGYLNREFSKLTDQGIMVLNSAGNFRDMVHEGPVNLVSISGQNFVTFNKSRTDKPEFKTPFPAYDCPKTSLCFFNAADENRLNITAVWNRIGETVQQEAAADLDIRLLDANSNLLFQTDTIKNIDNHLQRGFGHIFASANDYAPQGGWKYQPHSWEILDLNPKTRADANADDSYSLRRGWYQIKLKVKTLEEKMRLDHPLKISVTDLASLTDEQVRKHQFNNKDKFRVVLGKIAKPGSIFFVDATNDIAFFAPADHKQVVTISDNGPRSSRHNKLADQPPYVVIPMAEFRFSDLTGFGGRGGLGGTTSGSTFAFAAMMSVLKGTEAWTTQRVFDRIKLRSASELDHPLYQALSRGFTRTQLQAAPYQAFPQNTRFEQVVTKAGPSIKLAVLPAGYNLKTSHLFSQTDSDKQLYFFSYQTKPNYFNTGWNVDQRLWESDVWHIIELGQFQKWQGLNFQPLKNGPYKFFHPY